MAGTADNWVVTDVARGPGKLYAGLAIPGAGGRLILSSDGTPDATQNPSAVHLGMTEEGVSWSIKPTITNFPADEFQDPIISTVTGNEIAMTGSLLQIMNMAIVDILLQNATRSDLAGTQGVTIGTVDVLQYTSVACIFPIEESSGPTIYGVMHLYRAFNDQGLAAQITSKKLGATPFAFRGNAVTTRAKTDTTGRFYRQLAGAAS
jgi:hypothetical protein